MNFPLRRVLASTFRLVHIPPMICQNILGAIGKTPKVKLNRMTTSVEGEVYIKLEFINPCGPIKDRIGYWLVEDAET